MGRKPRRPRRPGKLPRSNHSLAELERLLNPNIEKEPKMDVPEPPQIVKPAVETPAPVWKQLTERINILLERISKLESRVSDLENGSVVSVDDPNREIVEFFKKNPGMKFNTGSVAANMGTTSIKLSDKLKTLAQKGILKTEKQEGLSAMYWYEEKEKTDESV